MDWWYQWYPIFPEKSHSMDWWNLPETSGFSHPALGGKTPHARAPGWHGWWPLVSMRRLTQVSLHGYGALCDLVHTKMGYSIAPKHVPYMMNHWIEGNISNLRINPKIRSYRSYKYASIYPSCPTPRCLYWETQSFGISPARLDASIRSLLDHPQLPFTEVYPEFHIHCWRSLLCFQTFHVACFIKLLT